MTNRERAMNILHGKDVDRLPAVHFGYWKELLLEWASDGYIPQSLAERYAYQPEVEAELDKILGWDFGWGVNYGARMGLLPSFEPEVLAILPDGTRRVRNSDGLIERIRPGISSIPSEDDYTLKNREAFEALYRPRMQYSDARVNKEFFRDFNRSIYEKCDAPIGLSLGSVLGTIRNITSVVGMSYLLYDEDEDLFADIVDTFADMQYTAIEEVLKTGAKFDYGHYWEDICFKSGPLLSPEIFNELCAKHYKKRSELLKKYGIDLISLDCDGVVEKLIPTWYENGVNILFPIEVGVWGDQFAAARERFGNGLRGVGGMDKTVFRKDKAAVDAEIERLKRLVSLGGFLPCPDHRLMPGSKFDLVKYYAEEIKKIRI